jgi:type IV pilus assembly protein PilB
MAPRKRIGEILIAAGLIDQNGLRAGLAEQQRWGGPLGRILIDMRLVSEVNLVAALSHQLNIPTVDLEKVDPAADVLALISADLAVDHTIIPFAREGKFLDVAMADPTNVGVADELRIRTKLNVRPHLAGPKAIERALARFYHRGPGMLEAAMRNDPRVGSKAPPIAFQPRDGVVDFDETPSAASVANAADVAAMKGRIDKLEALVARDEQVLRKVLALLVEKGLATREEILERLK